jgi:hypothetical protein
MKMNTGVSRLKCFHWPWVEAGTEQMMRKNTEEWSHSMATGKSWWLSDSNALNLL